MTHIVDAYEQVARTLHDGHVRKYTGLPYATHLAEVEAFVASVDGGNIVARSAAWGHDIYEDILPHLSVLEFYRRITEMVMERLPSYLQDDAEVLLTVAKINAVIIELSDVFTKERYPSLNRAARKGAEALRLGGISADAKTVKLGDLLSNTADIQRNDPKFAVTYLREKREILEHLSGGVHKGNKCLFDMAMAFSLRSTNH